jgi:hydroxymethylpyrimidine/phosphomethylpyrimidine kinase
MAPALVAAQIDAVFEDMRVDAIKIGMLASAPVARTVAARLRHHGARRIVLDPVLAATTGTPLLHADALAVLREELLPMAELLTPNLVEAAVLLGEPAATDLAAMQASATRLRALGPAWVLLKGGHLAGPHSPDLLLGGDRARVFDAPRIDARGDRGTGCTLAAAIAALLPTRPMPDAVAGAKRYLEEALRASAQLSVGRIRRPLQHCV